MKFPKFPTIEGYPGIDPDLWWGYACADHVPLNEFREACREQFGVPNETAPPGRRDLWPHMVAGDSQPNHAFVSGRKTVTFCFPDDKGAKPITFWHGDGCSYTEWLMQMLKDICRGEMERDAEALRLIHTLQMFRYGTYQPE